MFSIYFRVHFECAFRAYFRVHSECISSAFRVRFERVSKHRLPRSSPRVLRSFSLPGSPRVLRNFPCPTRRAPGCIFCHTTCCSYRRTLCRANATVLQALLRVSPRSHRCLASAFYLATGPRHIPAHFTTQLVAILRAQPLFLFQGPLNRLLCAA